MPKRARFLTALAAASLTSTAALAGGVEPIETVRVASGLNRPLLAIGAPGDYKRLYIVEKRGVIRVLNLRTGQMNASPFMDIDSIVFGGEGTQDERGLLGMAFHPNFQENRYFYLYFTTSGGNGITNIARFTAATRDVGNSATRVTLLTMQQPYGNHNGGWIEFGPNDGYLYIGTGDGGLFGDPGNRAQTITNQLLGKILRIDVDADDRGNYGIPADNPFAKGAGDDEIWAYGLRNPWRCGFDRLTGDLYIGDVGQDLWEELSYQPADSAGGENYGWRCREGAHNYNFSGGCNKQTFVEPIYEYSHGTGITIVGGPTYRGCAIPSLRGHTFFADYGPNHIWTFDDPDNPSVVDRRGDLSPARGGQTVNQIVSINEDTAGELYIVDHGGSSSGQIFKVVPVTPTIDRADVNCDGMVGFADLLAVLTDYGPCDGCNTDLDWDDDVDFDDVLFLLARWGT